jgi:hypothetical protein
VTHRRGERLPSTDELLAAVGHIADRGDATIAGGLAMQLWGSPRLTGDLDVVADEPLGYAGEPLSFGGVRTTESGIKLDVIVRNDEWRDLYVEAIDHAVDMDGVPLPVVTPEYLVAMKMVAGRGKDEEDVKYLVTMTDFDQPRTEAVVRRHLGAYAVKELRAIVDEAKWRRSRGEE